MKKQFCGVVVMLMCAACGAEPPDVPANVDAQPAEMLMAFGVATFEPGRLYGQLAHLYGRRIAGQPMNLVEIRLTDIRGEPRLVDVLVEIEGLANPWRETVHVSAGRTTWVSASPRLNLAKVYKQTDSVSTTVTVTMMERGVVLARQSEPLEVQPIEQFTWFSREGADDPLEDMRPFLATMIAGPARARGRDAFEVVEAQYAWMQSHMMCCHGLGDAYFDQPSRVRWSPWSRASVVEGVIWLAGALEAVGVDVALVFLSDHMLLGFEANGQFHFLDLTITDGVEQSISAGNRLFATRQDDPLFRFISLRALRQMGISPMPQK